MESLLSNRKSKIANILFYAAFLLDVIILCTNNTGIEIPYRGRLLQLAALIWGIKILLTKYTKKEWVLIVCVALLSLLPFVTLRETVVVQVVLMILASKDMDRSKLLRCYFFILLFTMVLMAVLSGMGVIDNFALVKDFDRGEVETRYCFGFNHPNVFYSSFFNLVAIGMCAFYEKMKSWHYAVLTVLNCFLMYLSASRTGFIVVQVLIVAMFVIQKWPQIMENKVVYSLGHVAIGLAALLSYSIFLLDWDIVVKLDGILTGRVGIAQTWGHISNWELLPVARDVEGLVLDMGFVNLMFYWGIILGAVYLFVIFWNYRSFRIKKDYSALVILLTYTLFTMIEAHAFSMYFVGNLMFIMMLGWGKEQKNVSAKKSDS